MTSNSTSAQAPYIAVVTGASGYIASHLVAQLLGKGWTVRGTVRDPEAQAKVQHLTRLGEALPGNLSLHAADLTSPGSFDAVIKGADLVFHVASPWFMGCEDPEQMIRPAVDGTRNVLDAVAKSKATVKATVVTSSFAAIVKPKSGPIGSVYTEEDWNTDARPVIPDNEAYYYSKVTAEKEAFKIAEQEGLRLLVVNPALVMGPPLSSRLDATSVEEFKKLMEGTSSGLLSMQLPVIDVRDVARAHILAALNPQAKGRFLTCSEVGIPVQQYTEALAKRFPHFRLPDVKEQPAERIVDNAKVQKLGLHFTAFEETITDMASAMLSLNLAKPTLKRPGLP